MLKTDAVSGPSPFKLDNVKPENANIVKRVGVEPFGKDGFSFFDFLDILNPLQHIPLVSTLYRKITGDDIDPASRLVGSAVYGGPMGAVTSLVDVVIKYNTGKDVGEHALEITGYGETKQKNASDVDERNRASNPTSINRTSRSYLAGNESQEGFGTGVYNNSLKNPSLPEQRVGDPAVPLVLLRKIEARIDIENQMRSEEKTHSPHAVAAYKEAVDLK